MPVLTWLTREYDLKSAQNAPYRLLEETPELSAGDAATENMLIHGDNLDALKALLPYYAGQVKCIYIDPPYNTRSAFEHYDDNLEHSQWLAMIYPRLEMLRELLAEEGSIWVSIDDNEGHYLKVIMDEVFGRRNFVGNVIWQKKFSPQNDAKLMDADHDHIMCFAKSKERCELNLLERSEEMNARYKNTDNDPRGPWTSGDSLRKEYREYAYYEITIPSGRKVLPPPGSSWRFNKEEVPKLIDENRLWFGKDGNGVPRIKRFLTEVKAGVIPQTIWKHTEVGNTQEAKKETININREDIFDTPKPERLLKRIIEISTNPNDLVLDSFLGSGTTAAVALKMGRRYIGIEMGDHAVTHCVPRLKKVIDGEQGGISQAVNWQGGGGFRFYRLGEAIFDEYGQINRAIKFSTLAAHIWFCETRTPWSQPHPHPNPPLEGEGIETNPSQPPLVRGGADNLPHDKGGLRGVASALSPLLGIHNGTAYYLLYNGILGDKRPDGGNVLTGKLLQLLPQHDGPKVIYGETSRLGDERLRRENITFRQIPYDIKAR